MLSKWKSDENELIRHDQYGSFWSTKGNRGIKLFGITIFKHTWDTKYVDSTNDKQQRTVGLR